MGKITPVVKGKCPPLTEEQIMARHMTDKQLHLAFARVRHPAIFGMTLEELTEELGLKEQLETCVWNNVDMFQTVETLEEVIWVWLDTRKHGSNVDTITLKNWAKIIYDALIVDMIDEVETAKREEAGYQQAKLDAIGGF